MAYGLSVDDFNISEMTVDIGTLPSPETVGTDAVDPISKFVSATGGSGFANISQGTLAPEIRYEFARAYAGTPRRTLRTDVVAKEFVIAMEVLQWNADILEL